jgi:hypothetical protein
MSYMTDDCVYHASAGPEPGSTYRGKDEVRPGFAAVLAYDHGRERHDRSAFINENVYPPLSVAYLGVFTTALPFPTWGYAPARTSAGAMGATTYLVPAIATLLFWAILGQVPGWLAVAGGGLCLAGVACPCAARGLQADHRAPATSPHRPLASTGPLGRTRCLVAPAAMRSPGGQDLRCRAVDFLARRSS